MQRAMRDELARSMRQLRLDTMPQPYFIAYRVDETMGVGTAATVGSLLRSSEGRSRTLSVELRIGDYAFDNTNYLGMPSFTSLLQGFGGMRSLPLDDDYAAIRRELWLATDAAYKDALEQLSRKRAALQDAMRSDYIPDFSKEDVTTTVDEVPASLPARPGLDSLVLRLSALFREAPAIQRSSVACRATVARTRYVNSEGSSFTRTTPLVTLTVTASTQATDGRPLADGYQVWARSPAGLSAPESLAAAVRALATRLTRLRDVPPAEAYNGPVLFEGQAAAQLFGQVFAPMLVAARRPVSDNPIMERMLGQRDNPFLDEIGARVLPRFLSVTDDPTLATYEGRFAGGFRVDDDGVRARETRLVDRGILKALLATRVPVRGIPRSTGNRRGAGAVPGTLVVSADSGLSDAALRKELLDLAAARGNEYGIIVRRLASSSPASLDDPAWFIAAMGGSVTGTPELATTEVVKVFADGHEEPVRNVGVAGMSPQALKDIVAVSATHTAYTGAFLGAGAFPSVPFSVYAAAGAGSGVSTYVVPALLFEDVTLRPARGEAPRLPVLNPPWVSAP